MIDSESRPHDKRGECAAFLHCHSVSPVPNDVGSCWMTVVLIGLVCVLEITSTSDASAAPGRYKVGACLSVKVPPPHLKGQSAAQYYKGTISKLEGIAEAIKQRAPMEVVPVKLTDPPKIPGPRDCAHVKKRNYDIWLELTYEENETFLFEVSQRDGTDLKVISVNPDPWPDEARTRALLAEVGAQIIKKSAPPAAVLIEKIRDPNRGIVFLYDKSSSMYETDHRAKNRLAVGQRIGELVAQTAQAGAQPMPFAMVVFSDDAVTIENKPGASWFETTSADLQVAQTRLAAALKDSGNTNIEAAFKEVGRLISARKDIERWHVVFLTDGAPTSGATDYKEITKKVTTALGGKSTLSVIALHGNDPTHTEDAKLAELVRAIMDPTGQSGEIINLKQGDELRDFSSSIDRIAFLINRTTVRDEVALTCAYGPGAKRLECELDKSQPHALRFGAARKVTFIADTTALPAGRCTATIENEGLGARPRTIELPEGQPSKSLTESGFNIVLSRDSDRMFLMIEMTSGRVNGDWQIKLTAETAMVKKS